MALLRAFIDDSAAQKGDKRLFMAGYLHRADQWAHFSDAWNAELKAWPSIEYFKASEANSLDGQFSYKNGWTQDKRNAKVAMLAKVISGYQPFSFHFSVNRKIFEEELKPVSPRGLGNTHFTVCFAVVAGISQYAAQEGMDEPIEFVFDEQDGVSDDISLFFSHMKRNLPQAAQDLIDGVPVFKSDKDKQYLPLQAADMLAWHLRREHENGSPLPITRDLLHRDGHLVGEVPDDLLRKWADHHSKLPGVPLIQSRVQWRDLKQEIRRLQDAGIDPSKINGPGIYYPEGTPAIVRLVEKVRRLFRRG